jgi:hypothetical protein
MSIPNKKARLNIGGLLFTFKIRSGSSRSPNAPVMMVMGGHESSG